MSGLEIRSERAADVGQLRELHRAAFDTSTEANLVSALRARASPVVSLVAEAAGVIVGHVLFSPVTVSGHAELMMMGLAPMAVLPAMQRRGIGAALVGAGLDRCRHIGCSAIVVLGHPSYYPRFGFVPASRFGLGCEYDVPDGTFMALELETGALRGRSGTVRYHPAFADV
jgi:putative acetyltransferase